MGDLFKAITGGLARFVFAWMVPSVIALGLFWLFVLPIVQDVWLFNKISAAGAGSTFRSGVTFAFFVLVLSILFAYTSLPIYRLLEGYSLPRRLRRRLQRRHIIEWSRLQKLADHANRTGRALDGLTVERMNAYPQSRDKVQATRLGNALVAMETFGATRYGLDSQSLWYELQAVAPEVARKNTEDGRAPVDFFVSSIAHMGVLSITCLTIGIGTPDPRLILIGAGAGAVVPLCYRLAVKNVKDWGHSVKALVNLGRIPLANGLGLVMPATLAEEKDMWALYHYAIELGKEEHASGYDDHRVSSASRSAETESS